MQQAAPVLAAATSMVATTTISLGSAAGADFSLILKEAVIGQAEMLRVTTFSTLNRRQSYGSVTTPLLSARKLRKPGNQLGGMDNSARRPQFVVCFAQTRRGLSLQCLWHCSDRPGPCSQPGAVWLFGGVAGFGGMRFKQKSKAWSRRQEQ